MNTVVRVEGVAYVKKVAEDGLCIGCYFRGDKKNTYQCIKPPYSAHRGLFQCVEEYWDEGQDPEEDFPKERFYRFYRVPGLNKNSKIV